MEKLIEQVRQSESTKHIWRNDYQSIEWVSANKLNIQLFGMPLNRQSNCKCLEDLFFMLKSDNFIKKRIQVMESQFKVKAGKVLQSFKFGFQLTENSTDEQIIEALKVEPRLIVQMEKYPDNWEQIVNGIVEPVEDEGVDLDTMTKSELIEFAEMNNIEVDKRKGKQNIIEQIVEALKAE